MIKKIFTGLACLLITVTMFSQNVEFDKSNFSDRSSLKDALAEIAQGDIIYNYHNKRMYKLALKHYLKAHNFNPDNALLNMKIGHCYLYSNEQGKAIGHLQKAYELDNNVDPKIYFLLGMAHHLSMKWDKAVEEYEKYKNILEAEKVREGKRFDENRLKEVNKHIQECEFGKELVKTPVLVKIENIGATVNSEYADFGPKLSADESVMIFTSRREGSTGELIDPVDGFPMEDIYVTYNKDGIWSKPRNIGAPVNGQGHDATLNLSVDGQELYIYRDDNMGDIFICHLEGNKWSEPEQLKKKVINTHFAESSVGISPDGNTLYFVSNREGEGHGGYDIYLSRKDEKGKWKDPENLGPVINTAYNERAIFMHPDGKTLYFSSDGHETMGGLDIFKSTYENGQWLKPENIGYPVNTPGDDVDIVISASKRRAYYSSAALGGYGEKDIYIIYFPPPLKPAVLNAEDNLLASISEPIGESAIEPTVDVEEAASLTILKGIISDAITQKAVEATIEIVDNEKNEVISSFKSNSESGKYLVSLPSGKNYGIAVKAEGYLFHSENFNIPEASGYQEIRKDIELKNVEVGSKIVLRNIFFDYDKASLRPESFSELERLVKLLNDVSSLKIEISGHTDNKGSAEYNQKLSERRAKSVVDYLIEQGIKEDRLEFKGYGFEQPIATNDTEEGRQQNRRTEFKVLSR